MRLSRLLLAAALPVAIACGDDGPTAPVTQITFTGTTTIRNGTTIPSNARVLVLWGVSATSPDYSYVFGSGTINSAGNVTITFNGPPPAGALNVGQLGVGLVVITTDQTLAEGVVPANYSFPGVIGLSEDYSIIYTSELTAETTAAIPWTARFNGYGLGKVERSTTGFDSFAAVDPSTLKLVIDALANIHVPNWT
jgi:hypothetical protein